MIGFFILTRAIAAILGLEIEASGVCSADAT